MDEKKFYDSIRKDLFLGKISGDQFKGIAAILAEYKARKWTDDRRLAYVLATVFHETAKTMQPIREYGLGKGYDYGKKLDRGNGSKSRVPYTTPDQLYYGRGHVQLTWRSNYLTLGRLTGYDLLSTPDLMLQMDVSIKVCFEGMLKGSFTGVGLASYFTATKEDPVNARKIINGLDKAELIAGYYRTFLKALRA